MLCVLVGVVTVPLCTTAQVVESSPGLMAGAAKCSIVPPFPTQLGGFGDRLSKWTTVATPVDARALVLARGETKLVVVSTDLLNVSAVLVGAVRDRVLAELAIPKESVLISAAHNHSAPAGFSPGFMFGGEYNQPLVDFLVQAIVESITEANGALQPAETGYAVGTLDGITRNRQQGNTTAIDTDVGVLRVQKAGSRDVIATLFNFTGHPVILGGDNLQVCGEYPGQAQTTVESVLGGVALFTQGACGDITMQRSGPPMLEVQRLGRLLAGKVIETAERIRPAADAVLQSKLESVPVEPRIWPGLDEAKSRFAALTETLATAKTNGEAKEKISALERDADSAEWALRLVTYKTEHADVVHDVTSAPVHVMRIGDLVLVGIPGEMFCEYGLAVKSRLRKGAGLNAMLVGYANDYIGYIVTPRAVETGGYEQATTRLAPTAGRAMIEAAIGWVQAMTQAVPATAEKPAFQWPEGKTVALTLSFDDARESQLDRGVPILNQYDVKGTFYVLPGMVEKRLAEWKAALDAGHELGNHTDTHPCSGNFTFSRNNALENMSLADIGREMDRGNALVASLLGISMRNFAYPCGQMYVGRGVTAQSYVPVVAGKFVTGRGYMGEYSNDPMFCDMAQLFGVNFDGMTFEQALDWIEKAKKENRWLVLAGHDIGASGHQVVLEDTLHKLCAYAKDPANGIWIDTVEHVADYVVEARGK